MTLKEARKRKNLKLKDVAKCLKITASTISKYEKGSIIPKADQVENLLKLYEVQFEDIEFIKT